MFERGRIRIDVPAGPERHDLVLHSSKRSGPTRGLDRRRLVDRPAPPCRRGPRRSGRGVHRRQLSPRCVESFRTYVYPPCPRNGRDGDRFSWRDRPSRPDALACSEPPIRPRGTARTGISIPGKRCSSGPRRDEEDLRLRRHSSAAQRRSSDVVRGTVGIGIRHSCRGIRRLACRCSPGPDGASSRTSCWR